MAVRWTTDECVQLSQMVFSIRINHPEKTLIDAVNKAVQQMPINRRRLVRTHGDLKKLLPYIINYGKEAMSLFEESRSLKDRIATLEVKVLNVSSLDEVLDAYSLDQLTMGVDPMDLIQLAIDRVRSDTIKGVLIQEPIQQVSASKLIKRKKRVAVFGLKGEQMMFLKDRIGEKVDLIFSQHDNLPAADIAVVWAKFLHQSLIKRVKQLYSTVITHTGGIEYMAAKILEAT